MTRDFSLFDQTPIARSTDPQTSHDAAKHVIASGKQGRQQQLTVRIVRAAPGHTAAELGNMAIVPLDRYQLARRLVEV